jgi:NET1-associated nuclear protein 1 (U3 small nucleolar RNA-associated protein 17)
METGKTQQLPHLTAAIKAINVSPSGTSYALLLDDNSVMALSTSELVPTAVVGGLQIAGVHSRLDTDWSFNKSKELIHPIPAVANAFFPNQIFLATPASQTIENKTLSAPFIQTFDWATGRHVSRQALARNNVTNINTAPDGTAIIEANVTLMKISHDGLWLATAEEWTPTTSNQPGEAYSLAERRETYLKFWHWDTKNNQWMLEARIDSPHQSTTLTGANQILDLESNPTEVGFASAGQDGIVRVWSPKTKLSDGRIVKGVNLKGVTTWLCTQLIDIGKTVDISDPDADSQFSGVPSFAKIAFSDDGSVLAVSLEDAKSISPGLVHFIDVMSGTIRLSQPLVYGAGLAALQFLGRHLIVLSSELRVWDMVTNRLVYGYPLKQGNLPQVWKQNLNQLNASKKYGRFIISVPVLDNSNGSRLFSRIAVFDPLDPQPYLIHEMPTIVSSLIPLDSAYGFAIIDSEAEIRLVKPNVASAMDPLRLGEIMETGPVQDAIVQQAPEGNVFPDAEDNFQDDDHDDADDSESNQSDNGRNAVVGAHNLAKIFDSSPSFALPPVQDLFRAVASLYLGKSKTTIKQSGAVTAPKS